MGLPRNGDIKGRIREILSHMKDLERQLEQELHSREAQVFERVSIQTKHLEDETRGASQRVRQKFRSWLHESEPRNVLTAPIIYSLIIPIALLDLAFSLYQMICFPLYRIAKVERHDYIVIDRHKLSTLNGIEKLNCVYCGYANGVLAYACEIGASTEQYWCPIKHAQRTLGVHARYARFLEYGDTARFHDAQAALRAELDDELTASESVKSDALEQNS